MTDYEVIVIGGRPAGSTLAARLGKMGIRTLLVERQQLPSLPAASCPIIYAATMKLLDEIGAEEVEYAWGTPRLNTLNLHGRLVQSSFPLPNDDGRDYAYAIDRSRFDHALWQTALRYASVTGAMGFNVTDLLWDDNRVCGIVGKNAEGEEQHITARLVVGADGRFGIVARKTNAAIVESHEDHPTSIYYAYWKNLRSYKDDGVATSIAYEGKPGTGYLVMDSADNTAAVAIEGRSALMNPGPGQVEQFYLEMLQDNPALWARFENAEMVTSVRGMKDIKNLYREPGGPGWALVGDAYHQKDPLDGQGIYNAVFTAKALAWAIRYWCNGEKTWEDALVWYDETARIKTYAMYKALLQRVRVSLYSDVQIPAWLEERLGRWALEDPSLGQMYGRLITRQLTPEAMQLMTPPLVARALVRGGLRDLRKQVESMLPNPFRRGA